MFYAPFLLYWTHCHSLCSISVDYFKNFSNEKKRKDKHPSPFGYLSFLFLFPYIVFSEQEILLRFSFFSPVSLKQVILPSSFSILLLTRTILDVHPFFASHYNSFSVPLTQNAFSPITLYPHSVPWLQLGITFCFVAGSPHICIETYWLIPQLP